MAVDLKKLFADDDVATKHPAVRWCDAEAATAIDEFFRRVSTKIPVDFVFTVDDWQGLEPMEKAINTAIKEQDVDGLQGAIRAFEDEAERMVERRQDLFDVLDSLRDW
jgi:hypothetical protein